MKQVAKLSRATPVLIAAVFVLTLLQQLVSPESVSAAPPTEAEEEAAYQWLLQIYHEKDAGVQASPTWCEACKALGKARGKDFVSSLERYLWREDSRVKSDLSLEHYPALWTLAEIGTPALPMLAEACAKCRDKREAKVLALALLKLYGNQRFAERYLQGQVRRWRKTEEEEQAANVERVLAVLRTGA